MKMRPRSDKADGNEDLKITPITKVQQTYPRQKILTAAVVIQACFQFNYHIAGYFRGCKIS